MPRMCWNTTGTFLCHTYGDMIEYSQFVNHGLKHIAAKKLFDEKVYEVKYLNENVVCFNYENKVGIWDTRQRK